MNQTSSPAFVEFCHPDGFATTINRSPLAAIGSSPAFRPGEPTCHAEESHAPARLVAPPASPARATAPARRGATTTSDPHRRLSCSKRPTRSNRRRRSARQHNHVRLKLFGSCTKHGCRRAARSEVPNGHRRFPEIRRELRELLMRDHAHLLVPPRIGAAMSASDVGSILRCHGRHGERRSCVIREGKSVSKGGATVSGGLGVNEHAPDRAVGQCVSPGVRQLRLRMDHGR